MRSRKEKIGIIGDGGWGTANALLLKRNGHDVVLWGAFGDYVEGSRRGQLIDTGTPSEARQN